LSRAGARVVDIALNELGELPAINAGGGFAPIEAYAWHQPLLNRRGAEYDQRVRTRIERAAGMSAVDYIRLVAARADLIARVTAATAVFDALLMPTVAIAAPAISAFERDEDYRHLNALILRNTSVINFLDGCAATLPIATSGAPVGLMIAGAHGNDRRVLAVARGIEAALAS
jgi:aspartyl-tRNA(Asn)/glutamyl-tRNA(Gln) amidotransferase subunit A